MYSDDDQGDLAAHVEDELRRELHELRALARRVAALEAEPMWNQRKTVKMWSLTGVESVRAILADAQRLAGGRGQA